MKIIEALNTALIVIGLFLLGPVIILTFYWWTLKLAEWFGFLK